jgi:hypothetical protein
LITASYEAYLVAFGLMKAAGSGSVASVAAVYERQLAQDAHSRLGLIAGVTLGVIDAATLSCPATEDEIEARIRKLTVSEARGPQSAPRDVDTVPPRE